MLGGHLHRIITVIERLRTDFDKPLRIEALAQDSRHERVGFSPPFQGGHSDESLAIPEATPAPGGAPPDAHRKLDAANAGYRVGYEDASHFSREYKSLFGNPPLRDAEHLREAVSQSN